MVHKTEAVDLRPECSRGQSQVEVGIVGVQVPSSQYKAILRCGLPRSLVGGLQQRFGTILRDKFAAIDFTYSKTESTKSEVTVILVWTEIAVRKCPRE